MQPDVRKCRRCGEPAVVSVRDWKRRVALGLIGTERSVQTDWACQECGTKLSIRVHPLRIIFGLTLVPFTLICGPFGGMLAYLSEGRLDSLAFASISGLVGLVLAAFVLYPFVQRWRSPIAYGAPFPEVRFGLVEPGRRCRCGQTAPCTQVVARRVNGVPMGLTHTYGCATCQRTFAVESAWSTTVGLVGGSLFTAGGAYLMPSAWEQGWVPAIICGVVTLGAAVVAAQTAWRTANRFRHPEVALGPP